MTRAIVLLPPVRPPQTPKGIPTMKLGLFELTVFLTDDAFELEVFAGNDRDQVHSPLRRFRVVEPVRTDIVREILLSSSGARREGTTQGTVHRGQRTRHGHHPRPDVPAPTPDCCVCGGRRVGAGQRHLTRDGRQAGRRVGPRETEDRQGGTVQTGQGSAVEATGGQSQACGSKAGEGPTRSSTG